MLSSGITYAFIAVAGVAALAGASMSSDHAAAAARRETPVVTITAHDYAFESTDTVAAGLTTIRLANAGTELHHVQLVRVESGHTVQELLDLVRRGAPAPRWAHMVGGPNAAAPGAGSEATVDLAPGQYGILCWVHGPDGVSHFMKGMFRGLVVRGPHAAPIRLPKVDSEMRLDDYSYALSAPIVAGRRTIAVRNAAAQPHEVVIVQLAPGKSAQDLLAWLHRQEGPPPARPVGGTTSLEHGAVNYLTADFAPGRYALLCLVSDAKDGRPHVAHGMVREIEVM
jgi:uncharacterized cupredoxin-like copper-binding protein